MKTRSQKMGELVKIKKLIEEIQSDLKNKATNTKINELIQTIEEKDKRIHELESRIQTLEKSNELLLRRVDDNESYTRRQNLRIVGIPEAPNGKESSDECREKVKKELAALNLQPDLDKVIDRAHQRAMIVRFTSWRARITAYNSHAKNQGGSCFYVDLTKRRFLLMKIAMEKTRNNDKVNFAFADINNNVCLILKNGEKMVFNSELELDTILGKI